jgi:hypothetical protein
MKTSSDKQEDIWNEGKWKIYQDENYVGKMDQENDEQNRNIARK